MNNELNFTPKQYTTIDVSLYDFLQYRSQTHLDKVALSFYDKSITYKSLLEKIEETANVLLHFGVKKGDVAAVALPSIPDAVYLFYAINKVGAIYCGMDCRLSSKEISDIVKQVNPKICFVSDFHLKAFKEVTSSLVACVNIAETISVIATAFSMITDIYWGRTFLIGKKENFYFYRRFKSYKAKISNPQFPQVSGKDVCAYFYTSGTTYGRKCVVLTNENINSSVLQYSFSQEEFGKMGRFCSIMPPFTCYGISLGTHFPLIMGMQIRLIPLFTGKRMKEIIFNEKPSYLITVPSHWEDFIKSDFSNKDLSFLKGAIIGGDKLDYESELKLNQIFKTCNSTAKVMRGYGLTEASTAVTAQPANTPQGSVGREMCWSQIRIFDPDTKELLPPMEKGEICISGPNLCQGYLGDTESTKKLLQKHEDGNTWLHTGDIGYLDENGFLFFCERSKRMYVRFDGTKMSPYAIEQLIVNCPIVSRCLVVAIDDKEHSHGQCPKVFVVLNENITEENASSQLEKYYKSKIPDYMRPVETVFVEKLPITKNGKLDYFMATKND